MKKLIGLALLCGTGLLFAANLCQNPICGHPRWAHFKTGNCGYDSCTKYRNR